MQRCGSRGLQLWNATAMNVSRDCAKNTFLPGWLPLHINLSHLSCCSCCKPDVKSGAPQASTCSTLLLLIAATTPARIQTPRLTCATAMHASRGCKEAPAVHKGRPYSTNCKPPVHNFGLVSGANAFQCQVGGAFLPRAAP